MEKGPSGSQLDANKPVNLNLELTCPRLPDSRVWFVFSKTVIPAACSSVTHAPSAVCLAPFFPEEVEPSSPSPGLLPCRVGPVLAPLPTCWDPVYPPSPRTLSLSLSPVPHHPSLPSSQVVPSQGTHVLQCLPPARGDPPSTHITSHWALLRDHELKGSPSARL